LGQNQRLINAGLHPTEFFRGIAETIGQGRIWRGEMKSHAKDGSLYWVDATIVPLLDDHGAPHQITVISYDITERKRTKVSVRGQASLAQLGKMPTVVANEVRNPIAGTRGAMQILERRLQAAGPEQRVVRESVARLDALNDIVQDLLL